MCLIVSHVMMDSVLAASDSGGQNLGVTVDNTLVVVPATPIITSLDNISFNTLDLVVEVGSGYANEELNFVVTITNTVTGDVESVNYTQNTNNDAQTTLGIVDLDPGTEYDFVVRYARVGGVYSANSAQESVVTLIDSPVLESVDAITTESVNLNVIIDPVFMGYPMDFVVEIDGGGSTYTVQMTKNITGINVDLQVDGLDAGTDYTFKVKYARENTLNFSEYSNEIAITTESDEVDLEKPVIDDIRNITTNSMDIIVEVASRGGENLDFVVNVTNIATGETITIDFNETVGGGDLVTLGIGGLDPGTEYEFSVKYSTSGSSEYSDYSSTVRATTNYNDGGPTVEICFNESTVVIAETELQTYLDQGATVGVCSLDDNKKITICHNGNTISISRNALQAHLNKGATIGECPISGGSVDIDEIKDIITIVNNIDKDEIKDIIAPEEKKKTYQKVAVAGIAAGTTAALASSAIPLFATMPGAFGSSIFLQFLELFGIMGRRKEERNWGVVFDADTHMPIPAVKIVLLDQMGKEMATTYSDKGGRFGFLVSAGKYVIDVFKKDYTVVKDASSDSLYGNVYNGQSVTINEDHLMSSNIAMKMEGMNWQEYADEKVTQYNSKWSVFKKYFFDVIYVIGFGATIIVTYFYPSIFNFVVLGIYVSLFLFQRFFKKKKYGSIKTEKGKPVPFAVVKLYDKETNEKQNFAVTNSIGRYYLLTENGTYNLKAQGQPVSGVQFEKKGSVKVDDGIVRKDLIV